MTRTEYLLINFEFSRIFKYFDKRGKQLTVAECKQEFGALKLLFNKLIIEFGEK